MHNEKTGELIRRLRLEQGLTQKQLADHLHVSDRAVSKWERGVGLPDVSLLSGLSATLGVDVHSLLGGALNPNSIDGGNMKRIKFYRCPTCGNVLTSSSQADITCCGMVLPPLEVQRAQGVHMAKVENVEDEYLVSVDHPMTKHHHIAFIACASDDRVLLVRMYPEQDAQTRFPYMARATWFVCCTEHGLFAL